MDAVLLNLADTPVVLACENEGCFPLLVGDKKADLDIEDIEALYYFIQPYIGQASECSTCGHPLPGMKVEGRDDE